MSKKTNLTMKLTIILFTLVLMIMPLAGGKGSPNDNLDDLNLEIPETTETPTTLKQESIDLMNLLNLSEYDEDSADKINFIITNIQESLNPDFWWNETIARDDEIFALEKDAAQQIRVLIDREKKPEVNQSILVPAIIKLIQADNNLAVLAREEADWASQFSPEDVSSYLSDATEHHDKAWWHIERGYPVVAIDFFGKSWNASHTALLLSDQSTTPEVKIESPYDGIYTNVPGWALNGTVFDVRLYTIPEVSVTHNSDAYTLPLVAGTFTDQITLEENNNTINVSATDLFTNTGSGQISLILDTIPPEITITGVEDKTYYNYDITPHIEIFDLHLDHVTIRLNNDAFESDTTISEESDYILEVSAADKAMNTASETLTFTIDKTPPLITDDYADDGIWVNEDQTVTLIPTDELSGIKEVKYCEGAGCEPDKMLDSPYRLYYATDQDTTVRYQAWDKATNPSIIGEYNVKLDKTDPTTSDDYAFNNIWINSDPTITIMPSDPSPSSGIVWTKYCQIGECDPARGNDYINVITISTENINYFRYASEDNAGNIQPTQELTIKLDKSPPVTADNAPAEWQADDVNVVLTPLDIYSGVALTKYCMDTDNACTPSMERISLSVACPQDTICNRYLRYYSADNVGNKEEIKSTSVIKIDKENPVTELTLGTPKYISGKNYVTSNTQITLTADEGQGSGAAKTEYKVNLDGAWIEYIGPFTLKNEGLNTVYYRTIDNVRNVETTKSIEIIVDNTPPELKLTGLTENPTLDDPSYSFAIETEADATVTVNGEMLSLVEGKANYSVNITEGVNTFNVISKDPVENPTAKGITRLVDTDIMPDFYETDALGTHPLYNDSDSSRTADNEAENGITDDREDFDRDGLTNYAEYMLGSNPLSSDSDSDSLTDTYEALISKTNIIKYDSDENGLSDGNEDFDNDGLTNYNEQEFGSNPYMRDTDADGLTDKEEKLLGTDPLSTDTDKDGLNDKSEVELKGNPLNGDSDGDGVIDGSDIYEQAFVNETVKAEMTIDGIGDLSETTEIKKEDAPYVPVTSLSGISSEIIDFSTTSNFTEATIKIYYDEAKLEGSENQLKIYYFDENDGVPVAAPIQGINTNDNYAWAKTNHLSSWFIADPSGWEAQSNIAWNRADEVYSDEETIRVKARIHNSQPVPAYNLKVNFYEGNPGSGGKLIGTDTIDVPGNGVEIASVEWFVDADSDNVYVKVDPEGSTREIRENNNEAYREFTKEKDSDGDGLSDYEETNGMRVRYPYKFITTDPTNPDSDGDGLSDGEEMGAPVNNYYVPISYPTLADSDNDGLDDYEEKEGWYVNTIKNIDKLATVLQKLENDEDYVSLIEEYHVTSNPLRADTDKDGLSDLKEQEIGSSPRTFDTDSDKLKDSIDDDPTVVENTPPDVTIISMKTEDTGILSITGLVKYNVGDNVEVATITLKMDGNTVTSHFSEGMYEDGFTYNWLSTKAFGIDVNIVAKDVNNNEKKLPVIYEQGIIISFIQAIENTFKGLTIGSAGFGSGFAHGAVMEISDTVEFVGSIVKGDGIQVMEDAGRGIEQLGQQGPGIILEAFEYRIQETGIRKSSAEFFGIREGTSDYGLFTGAWNIGFATGYIATAVGEGILLSKGAGAAASIVKGLAKSGQLAGVASKLSKAGKILKTAASTSMKTRLLIGGSLVGGTYLLKEAFPDIDPLERLYYTNLGAASTFMFMGHGKKIHPLTALTEAEQSNLLRFAGVSMGERTASLRVNFLNKLDDVTRKKFANPNLKTKFMEDILGAVETHNLPNERIGRQIQGALDFDGVPNFEQKLRGTRKSLGNVWEIEGGSKLKERGFTIKHFEEEFLLTNGKKWPGDVSTLSPQGKKILHEMKGLDWDAADSLRQADEVKRILKQNNYMKDIKASGQIDNYIFELRTNPPKYIQDTLDLKGVPWEVLQ